MKKIFLTIALAFFYMASFAQVYYGLFEEGLPNNNTRLASIESELGKKPGLCLLFMSLPNNVDVAGCNNLVSKGITPIITLEPGTSYTNIINGNYDTYFRTVADQLKQINGTVFLRYAHEMNGNWYSWSGYSNGANATATANYIAAWRRVYGIIKTEKGANNVLWNWCVNGGSWPNETWNQHANYYPGDAYVDWIGFDSYDKPYNYTPTRYQTVEQTFGPVYDIITAIAPDKPVLVAEFASENFGHETDPHKAEFFSQAATMFDKYPRVHAFSYFNVAKSNSGRWNDYRINNPASLLPVFKDNWISNVNVIDGNTGIATLHIPKVVPATGILRVEAENYFDHFGIKSEVCGEGGLDAGSASTGDYMDYLINVTTAGMHTCNLRVANSAATGKIDIKNQSGTTLGSFTQTASTGGNQTYVTVSVTINLSAGKQKLRLYHAAGGLNVNWFELSKAVVNTAPSVSITSPATGSNFEAGTAITLTATASDTAPGTVSSVSFYDGATLLGTDVSSPYSFSWSGAGIGSHNVTAKATDNDGAVTTSVAVSITVTNTPPSVSITSPASGSGFTSGTVISLTATASDVAPGTISAVSFYDGVTLLNTDVSSPYSFSWSGASVGSHSITAKATDNNGAVTTSAAVALTVTAISDPLSLSYFHFINKWTADYMRPTAGSATAAITQYEETVTPTLDSYEWEFRAVTGTSYYYIINKYTQKAIQPTGGSTADNVGLSQTTLTAGNEGLTELHWSVTVSDEAPYYWIMNRKSLRYIRPNAGTNGTGVAIVQNTFNAAYSSFKWNLDSQGVKPAAPQALVATGSTVAEAAAINISGDVTKKGTAVYPNPADGIITISTEVEYLSAVTVKIYTVAGALVFSKQYQKRIGWFAERVNVSALAAGTYVLKIQKGDIITSQKLIKN
ncbi:Ig-like domain-containing protein [Ferruginibacter profundus]